MPKLGEPTTASKTEFGPRLRELRLLRGMSQAELAKQTHNLPGTISRYECGEREPNLAILLDIARCLGTAPNCLLGYPDAPHPQSDILAKFNSLDDRGKAAVLNVLEHEYTQAYKNKKAAPVLAIPKRRVENPPTYHHRGDSAHLS